MPRLKTPQGKNNDSGPLFGLRREPLFGRSSDPLIPFYQPKNQTATLQELATGASKGFAWRCAPGGVLVALAWPAFGPLLPLKLCGAAPLHCHSAQATYGRTAALEMSLHRAKPAVSANTRSPGSNLHRTHMRLLCARSAIGRVECP